MATSAQINSLVALYAGYFDRAPDPQGLQFWIQQIDAGREFATIAGDFAASPEATALYPFLANPTIATPSTFVTAIYQNLFNRAPDAEGLAFWTGVLAAGTVPVGDMIQSIINGAVNAPGATPPSFDVDTLTNKQAAGLDFATDAANKPGFVYDAAAAAAAVEVLNGVTNDPATVAEAAAETDAFLSGSGAATLLTINQDNLIGTAGSDKFVALGTQDGAGTLIDTLQSVDILDGGDGVDTLEWTDVGGNIVTPTMTNIENVIVRSTGGGELDLIGSTGVKSLTLQKSTANFDFDNVGAVESIAVKNQNTDVDFDDITSTTLAMNFDTVGSAGNQISVDLGDNVAAKTTTANITVKNANVDINSSGGPDVLKTANITATGTNDLEFSDSDATLETVTVKGSGSLDLTDDDLTAIKSFDGSASTGAIKVDIQSANVATVKTGSGNDMVDMDTTVTAKSTVNTGAGDDTLLVGAQLANFASVNGGGGTDIINITDGATLDAAGAAKISNFETLDVSGGKGNYDVSLKSFATVQIDEAINGALAANIDFKNAPDNFTFTVKSKANTNANFDVANNTTVTLKDATGPDVLTINGVISDGNKDNTADGSIDLKTVTAAGFETVNINATAALADGGIAGLTGAAHTLTVDLAATDATALNISGDVSTVVTDNDIKKVASIDASTSTGNVTIDNSASTVAVSYQGAEGVDTYTAGALGTAIAGNKGADAIDLTASNAVRDTVVIKAATDSQVTDTSTDGKITLGADAGFDDITAFMTGGTPTTDRIDVTNFAFTGTERGVVNASAKVLATTDLTSIVDLFADVAGDRGIAYSTIGGDTFVFIDGNKDGNFTAADDSVVKLTGVLSIGEVDVNF